MKKLICLLIIFAALLTMAKPVSAQDSASEKDFRFTIKTNPLAALGGPFWVTIVPITGEYKILFETVVSEKSSLQFGAGYLGPSVLLNLDELSSDEGNVSGIKTSGFRVQGMFKYFLSRDLVAPEGFYCGPHISYASMTMKNKDVTTEKIDGTKLNINGIFGYQMITSGGFTLDLFTGLGFVSRKLTGTGEDWDQELFKDKASINVPFGFSFGYAF